MSRTAMLTFVLALAARSAAAAPALAAVEVQGGVLSVRPLANADSVSVTVTGPAGYVATRAFGRGEAAELGLAQGGALADGLYLWEVRLNPAATRARDEGDAPAGAPSQPLAQSGQFYVRAGVVMTSNAAREPGAPSPRADGPRSPEDFVVADDIIVQGNACIGADCVDNEVFFQQETLLKNNNNSIRADDTSTIGGFAANDWEIRFNDIGSGGLNRFAVEDLTAARIPMSILAGAPNNSLFVDESGRLGVRTGTPVQTIHAVTGNTPGLRLDQDGSSGFSPQAWDIAGNEAGFFVRDVTGGSTLPFRIRPGAPSDSLQIFGTSGNVGIGTGTAAARLHVRSNDASTTVARALVEESNATTASRNLLRMVNNGASTFRFDNTASGLLWGFGSLGSGNFFMGATPGQPLAVTITPAGNMTITGTYASSSDRNAKADVADVDAQEVLAKVAALPVSSWRFKTGTERHLGPMAQDFSAAFGLGGDDTHIAPADVGGVALAAIQALKRQVDERDAEIRALGERLAALESRLAAAAPQP